MKIVWNLLEICNELKARQCIELVKFIPWCWIATISWFTCCLTRQGTFRIKNESLSGESIGQQKLAYKDLTLPGTKRNPKQSRCGRWYSFFNCFPKQPICNDSYINQDTTQSSVWRVRSGLPERQWSRRNGCQSNTLTHHKIEHEPSIFL